jgi:hypothetical protein
METKNSILSRLRNHRRSGPIRIFARARMAAGLAFLVMLSGCDNRDVSMQAELAGLREKIRKAEAERDLSAKDKTDANQDPSRGGLLPADTLKENLAKAMKALEQNAIAAFPGYRPAPGKIGRLFYVYDAADPYRATVELNLQPISGSALTPELPKVLVEARAGGDGVWQMPGQSTLRELQAAAVARNSGDRRPAEPAAKIRSQPPGPQSSGSARVIDWGDPRNSAEPRQPAAEQPAARSQQPSGNTPRATESYEIRFND